MLCTKREVLEHLCRNTNGCESSFSDNCEEIGDKIAQRRPPLYSGKKWCDDVSTSWVMNGNAFHKIYLSEDFFNTTRISRDWLDSYGVLGDQNHLVDIFPDFLIPYIRNDVNQNNEHTQLIQQLIDDRNKFMAKHILSLMESVYSMESKNDELENVVLVVIGAGHMDGIVKILEKNS